MVGTGSYITPDFAFPYGANFLKLPSTRVRVKSAWINSTPCGLRYTGQSRVSAGTNLRCHLRAIGHSMSEEIIYDAEGHP